MGDHVSSSNDLSSQLKLFLLETDRLEFSYQALKERFTSVQSLIHQSNTKIAGKLAELDFTSRYLEVILNHISQGILFLDFNGMVTTCNHAASRLLQISAQDLLFHSFHDFFDDSYFGFSLKHVLSTKQPPCLTLVSWKNSSGFFEVEVEATFVSMSLQSAPMAHRSSAHSPQGLLILLRDVTKIRRLQENALHNQKLQELGQLAAHLAHEIRNPLGGIRGFASLLSQELNENPHLKKMADYIIQGADDLNIFVTQILQYARPFQTHLEMKDVVALVMEIQSLLQADVHWNSTIRFTYQSNYPQILVPIDAHLLKSALFNLCVNACQAMPHGGDLDIKIEKDFSFIIIEICDTGCGIAPEHLSKIFTPFFTTKETGNGLGLAEVQKVIQAHHGWIEVQSEVDLGTKFSIKIPLKMEE